MRVLALTLVLAAFMAALVIGNMALDAINGLNAAVNAAPTTTHSVR